MRKQLVVPLDGDVAAGLNDLDEATRTDLTLFANEALREALRRARRCQALDVWVHGLDDEDSPYTAEQRARAKAFFEENPTTVEVVAVPGEARRSA